MASEGNRSKLWAGVLAIAVVTSVFVGLASQAMGAASTVGTRTSTVTTLRLGSLQEPDSLNPFVGVLSASYVIWAHTYELLVGIGPKLEPVPALAQSWEVDASGYNWTFHLVHNATYHDGVPFTAEDVNFTYRYVWAQTPWNPGGCNLLMLQSYLGDPATNTGVDVNNITVIDPYTIRIPTYTHKANILSMFIQILPKHYWQDIGCDQATHVSNNPPIGTGMYKVTTWVRGSYIQLDLNTAYWRLDPTTDYVNRIVIRYYATTDALYNAFLAGDIDGTDVLPADKFTLIGDKVAGSSTPNVGKLTLDAIEMTEMGGCLASDALITAYGAVGGRNWLVTNRTVRQAMQLSVDRANLVQNVIYGLGKPGGTLIPPATPFWHYNLTAAEVYAFDLNHARQLLNDPKGDGMTLKAGQTDPGPYGQNLDPAAANNQDAFIDTNGDGIREVVDPSQVVAGDDAGTSAPNNNQLNFNLEVRSYDANGLAVATRMEGWWNQIGIKVTTQPVDEGRLISDTYDCSEDFYVWGWGGDVDPDFLLSVMTSAQIQNWQDAWYYNKTYDELYYLQQTQINATERQQTIWEMQRILYQDAAYLVVYYPFTLAAVRTDTFTGWGNWSTNPGLGFTGYGNDFLMLSLRAVGTAGPTNNCPTVPILEGDWTRPHKAYLNTSVGFTATAMDPEGDPITWILSWDDGNTSTGTTIAGMSSYVASYAWSNPGTYYVRATVTDDKCGALVTSGAVEVDVGPAPTHLGWVAGTVREANTDMPVEDSTISASVGAVLLETSANAEGRYNMTVETGTYLVQADAHLYGQNSRSDVVVAENATTVVDFSLDHSRGWVAGTVSSSAGGALPSALVHLAGLRSYALVTDSSGHYNLTVAPDTYQANVSLGGYNNKGRSGLAVANGQTVTLDFSLDPVTSAAGLSPLVIAGIAAIVLIAAAGVVAFLLLRRRRKAEEIQGPPLPPKKPEGPQP